MVKSNSFLQTNVKGNFLHCFFLKDPRMMVRQDLSAGEWQLIIKDVRYSDAGQYECQINTSPVLSHTLKLAVVGECEHSVPCYQPPDPPGIIMSQYFPPLHFSSMEESAHNISLIIFFTDFVCNFEMFKQNNKWPGIS